MSESEKREDDKIPFYVFVTADQWSRGNICHYWDEKGNPVPMSEAMKYIGDGKHRLVELKEDKYPE